MYNNTNQIYKLYLLKIFKWTFYNINFKLKKNLYIKNSL